MFLDMALCTHISQGVLLCVANINIEGINIWIIFIIKKGVFKMCFFNI